MLYMYVYISLSQTLKLIYIHILPKTIKRKKTLKKRIDFCKLFIINKKLYVYIYNTKVSFLWYYYDYNYYYYHPYYIIFIIIIYK